MGNICEILSGKRYYNDSVVIAPTIPVATPVFDYDISNNIDNMHSTNYVNGIPVQNSNLYYGQYYGSQQIGYQHPRQSVIVVQQPGVIYNDPTSSAMTGFLGGMIIGEMLDGDCY